MQNKTVKDKSTYKHRLMLRHAQKFPKYINLEARKLCPKHCETKEITLNNIFKNL